MARAKSSDEGVEAGAIERPTVVAVYFPAWHRYDHMDCWKGEGWTEWDLVKNAPKRFEAHHQPLEPEWGKFDESDPAWAANEIDLAADHGIDVFLYDWYWYNGVRIMEEALERGFLRASNRRRMRFALMWANHHWGDYFPAPQKGAWNNWLPIRHTAEDFDRLMEYCVEHYFREPNYWRLKEEIFFSIFQPEVLIDQLGGVEKTRGILKKMDEKMHRCNLPSIHWNGMVNEARSVKKMEAAGFTTSTSYNVIASGKMKPEDRLVDQYEGVMEAHREHWERMRREPLEHIPVVTMGWDVTSRCREDAQWPFAPVDKDEMDDAFSPFANADRQPGQHCYPYIHVVVGNTPERFEQLCRDAKVYLKSAANKYPVVLLNAWNEWTEGCYLLPEKKYGKGFIEAVRSAYGRVK